MPNCKRAPSASVPDNLKSVNISDFRFQIKPNGQVDIYEKQESFPSPAVPNPKRVFGLLTHPDQNGKEIILQVAFSGNDRGDKCPGNPAILSKKKWVATVKHLGRVLHMTMGSIYDAHGSKHGISSEQIWSYHASHVEKKLAAFAVAVILRETGYRNDLLHITASDLIHLGLQRWTKKPMFRIHISRDPCALCRRYVFALSSLTTIPILIQVAPYVSEVALPSSRRPDAPIISLKREVEIELDMDSVDFRDVDPDTQERLQVALNTPLDPKRQWPEEEACRNPIPTSTDLAGTRADPGIVPTTEHDDHQKTPNGEPAPLTRAQRALIHDHTYRALRSPVTKPVSSPVMDTPSFYAYNLQTAECQQDAVLAQLSDSISPNNPQSRHGSVILADYSPSLGSSPEPEIL